MQNLTSNVKTIVAKGAVAAGSTDITDASVIDMQGYEGARFIFLFGTLTGGTVTSVAVAGKDTNNPAAGTDDLAGTGIAVADTEGGKAFIVDIAKPTKRYLRPHVKRATQNAVLNGIIVELYGAREKPATKDATVSAQEIHAAPAVGTA